MDKLKMMSMDKVQGNIEKIRALFPNAVTEVLRDGKPELKVDFDVLKQELADTLIDDRELRYQFTWPDKQKSVLLANTPVDKTLRPCKEESVDFDNTQNLYIEGDNLEVLKLLQETYLGKIKMIYIDPPYNTGNDFVYNDDFAQDSEEYIEGSGQLDEQGNRLVLNTESNGRFHTDWLNMIYPRLRLAKDLLSDDGVIFISIDDNEVDNLRKICDEVFGESNFIAQSVVQRSTNGMGDKKGFARNHEYILCYQKSLATEFLGLKPDKAYMALFDSEDKYGKYKIDGILMKKGAGSRRIDSPTLYYPLYYSPLTGEVSLEPQEGFKERYPYKSDGSDGRWTWGKEKVKNESYRLFASANGTIYIKDYFTSDRRMKMKTILVDTTYLTDRATNEIKDIFEGKIFDTPKPIKLIKDLCDLCTCEDDIILDFFSGSATTAHAVMQLNAEDGGNRKFIMVQLPELCDEKSEAYKAGYKDICEIGKERIRRAGAKIKQEQGLKAQNLDIGFRVLKLDSSNMQLVYYHPEAYTQTLLDNLADNIKADRTSLDLLFQVMLDLGKPLSAKIEEKDIAGKHVFIVNDDDLIACFDNNVTEETVKAIAQLKPLYAVFRDSSLSSDSTAANFDQIFATYSPNTVRKVL